MKLHFNKNTQKWLKVLISLVVIICLYFFIQSYGYLLKIENLHQKSALKTYVMLREDTPQLSTNSKVLLAFTDKKIIDSLMLENTTQHFVKNIVDIRGQGKNINYLVTFNYYSKEDNFFEARAIIRVKFISNQNYLYPIKVVQYEVISEKYENKKFIFALELFNKLPQEKTYNDILKMNQAQTNESK